MAVLLFAVAPAQAGAELKPVVAPADISRMPALHKALAQHTGSPVLVNFWGSWCEPCREEMPSLQRLSRDFAARGLVVLTVAVNDTQRDVAAFLRSAEVDLPVIHDADQSGIRALGIYVLPTTLLLDRAHTPVLRAVGEVDWDAAAVRARLTGALAGQMPR